MNENLLSYQNHSVSDKRKVLLMIRIIAPDKALSQPKSTDIFLFLIENICCGEIRKILCGYSLLSGDMRIHVSKT